MFYLNVILKLNEYSPKNDRFVRCFLFCFSFWEFLQKTNYVDIVSETFYFGCLKIRHI